MYHYLQRSLSDGKMMRNQFDSEAFDELKANDKKLLLLDYPAASLSNASNESGVFNNTKSPSSNTSIKSNYLLYSNLVLQESAQHILHKDQAN